MNTLRLLICRTTTVTFGSSMNLPAVFAIWSRSSLGFRPAALMSPQQRQRDVPVGTDRDLLRHVGVAPEHDAQDVVGADHVVGRDRQPGGGRAGAGGRPWRVGVCAGAWAAGRVAGAVCAAAAAGSAMAVSRPRADGQRAAGSSSHVSGTSLQGAGVRTRRTGPASLHSSTARGVSKEQEALLARRGAGHGNRGAARAEPAVHQHRRWRCPRR